MSDTLLQVGTAGCFAACGALLLAARDCGRRAAALTAEPARLHVSAVEAVADSPRTGELEVLDFWGGCRADLLDAEFRYCPEDLRVTKHAVRADGSRPCHGCHLTSGDA
ncbi:hypothetical protein ABZ682_22635 [Streptomyces griseoviridis]|uniref:hypothetical protein n=1 Tax=Streptomyces griseoviridis TaxID=45398 RepID=UPI0033C6283C